MFVIFAVISIVVRRSLGALDPFVFSTLCTKVVVKKGMCERT